MNPKIPIATIEKKFPDLTRRTIVAMKKVRENELQAALKAAEESEKLDILVS
jgi:hypothetical protein